MTYIDYFSFLQTIRLFNNLNSDPQENKTICLYHLSKIISDSQYINESRKSFSQKLSFLKFKYKYFIDAYVNMNYSDFLLKSMKLEEKLEEQIKFIYYKN
jgi:hypothetical protein